MISTKSNSNIIQTGKKSNISSFKNIILENISFNNSPKPGDIVTCPNGDQVLVDEFGNYYCDIDPNGNGLRPFTDITCANGLTTSVNINGNIIGGCTPANGSEVTCYAGFTATVENGVWSCTEGDSDNILPFQASGIQFDTFQYIAIGENSFQYIENPSISDNLGGTELAQISLDSRLRSLFVTIHINSQFFVESISYFVFQIYLGSIYFNDFDQEPIHTMTIELPTDDELNNGYTISRVEGIDPLYLNDTFKILIVGYFVDFDDNPINVNVNANVEYEF